MSRINAGDLRLLDLVAIIRDLQARVKTLELQVGMRAVTFATQASSVSSTSFATVAWSVFPRSGGSLAVDITVGAAVEVQASVDGVPFATKQATAAGTVTLSGFLPESWKMGDRKRVEIKARLLSGSSTVSVTVLGGWHR